MPDEIVRLQALQLEDFQNVAWGEISFACNARGRFFGDQADVMGIYGQNGSGKTALIHAIATLKAIFCGKPVGKEGLAHIRQGRAGFRLGAMLSLRDGAGAWRLEYCAAVARQDLGPGEPADPVPDPAQGLAMPGHGGSAPMAAVVAESLKYAEYADGAWGSRKTILEWRREDEGLLSPKKSVARLVGADPSVLDDLRLARKLALRQGSSFLFSDDMRQLARKRGGLLARLLLPLFAYAEHNLYIIGSRGWGPIAMNTGLPFHFRVEEDRPGGSGKNISMGLLLFRLDGPTVFPAELCAVLEKAVLAMNEALCGIVPGMRLRLRRMGRQLLASGKEAIALEPVTVREGTGQQIPLRHESEGIKKLIAMLGMFLAAYRSPALTLAIDELDAGLHEYLLGELLTAFQQGGKGQLVFTSHNLRPLECLDKRSVVFATADPGERYVRLKNIKTNNNLRDVYYHAVLQGGHRLYESVAPGELRRIMDGDPPLREEPATNEEANEGRICLNKK